jgi:sRNA-binding carbon storage regulator CsrA
MNGLILGRKPGQEIVIDVKAPCRIVIKVLEQRQENGYARLAVNAPKDSASILRGELLKYAGLAPPE